MTEQKPSRTTFSSGSSNLNPVQTIKTFSIVPNLLLDSELFSNLSPAAFKVFVVLRRHSGVDDRPVWPSRERIAKVSGMSVSHVKRCLVELERVGLISREFRKGQSTMIRFLDLSQLNDEVPRTVFDQNTPDQKESSPAHQQSSPTVQIRPPEPKNTFNQKTERTNAYSGKLPKTKSQGSLVGDKTTNPQKSEAHRILIELGFSRNYLEVCQKYPEKTSSDYLKILEKYIRSHPNAKTLRYPKRWAQKVILGEVDFEVPKDLKPARLNAGRMDKPKAKPLNSQPQSDWEQERKKEIESTIENFSKSRLFPLFQEKAHQFTKQQETIRDLKLCEDRYFYQMVFKLYLYLIICQYQGLKSFSLCSDLEIEASNKIKKIGKFWFRSL